MAGRRNDDEERRPGLVRVVDEDELDDEDEDEDEEDPSATRKGKPGAVVSAGRANPGNGNGGEDEDELRSKVAKLEGEVARLRVAAGLEGRREEVATVGDVLAANEAQAAALRAELAETFRQNYDELCDSIAERVEERLLDTVAPEDEDEDEDNGGKTGKAGVIRRGKRTGKKPEPRNVRELEGPYARDGERGLWYVDEAGNWYDEDGQPAAA